MHSFVAASAGPTKTIADLLLKSRIHRTSIDAGEMIWRCWGRGPPLIFLHGGEGSWTHWIRSIEPFMATHQVWVPDLPGFGDSAAPASSCDAAQYVELIADGVRALFPADRSIDLVGFSFGGEVAGPAAVRLPDHLRRLVIVGSNSLDLPLADLSGLTRWRGLDAAAEIAAHRRNLEVLMLADPSHIDEMALHIQMVNARNSRFRIRALSETNMLLASLANIKAKLFGIWGEYDNPAGAFVRERERVLKAQRPDSEFHVIAGAGHWVMYEGAESFNTKLRQIIDSPP